MIRFLKNIFHSIRRFIAKIWLILLPARHIAITGSQGKTGTTTLIYNCLREFYPAKGQIIRTDMNLDTIYNIPITALKARPNTKFIVFETGIDKPGEMDFHLGLVNPFIAVLTGISPVHADNQHLGSLENIIREKHKLPQAVKSSGYVVLNHDDKNVRAVKKNLKTKKVIFYGKNPRYCQIYFRQPPEVNLEGTRASFFFRYTKSKREKIQLTTPLVGVHHIYNIMATFGVLMALCKNQGKKYFPKTWIRKFIKAVQETKPLPGRMSIEKGPGDTIILNDSLRANPASSRAGIMTFSQIKHKGRKIIVMGEMGELGKYAEKEHKKIGELILSLGNIDYFLGIGDLHKFSTRLLLEKKSKTKTFNPENVIEAAEILKKILQPGDFIYLKSSLLKHIERVILLLQGKRVGCSVISCPFYHPCQKCQYLEKGYQP